MKYLSSLLLLLAICTASMAQSEPHNILRKYKNNDGVMALKFEGDVMNMLQKADGQPLKSDLEYMDIIVFKKDTDISKADQAALMQSLANDNFELLINARAGGNKIKLLGLDNGESLSHVFLNANTEEVNVYVVMKGSLYFEELKDINLDKLENFMD